MDKCNSCGEYITNETVLKIEESVVFHLTCLRCYKCHFPLKDEKSCFLKDGKIYCQTDYQKTFINCCGCMTPLQETDYVMKADDFLFHVNCFCCSLCCHRLLPGSLFRLEEGKLVCRKHFTEIKEDHNKKNEDENSLDQFNENNTFDKLSRNQVAKVKPTRMRTVINEKQLTTLKDCYSKNPRPDACKRKHLAMLTGLESRVIRVWFQNKRCKDKKRCVAEQTGSQDTNQACSTSRYRVYHLKRPRFPDKVTCDQ